MQRGRRGELELCKGQWVNNRNILKAVGNCAANTVNCRVNNKQKVDEGVGVEE